eukprot:scaffold496073_cov29-Prasinocladus_malaysianus.AAC.1
MPAIPSAHSCCCGENLPLWSGGQLAVALCQLVQKLANLRPTDIVNYESHGGFVDFACVFCGCILQKFSHLPP